MPSKLETELVSWTLFLVGEACIIIFVIAIYVGTKKVLDNLWRERESETPSRVLIYKTRVAVSYCLLG